MLQHQENRTANSTCNERMMKDPIFAAASNFNLARLAEKYAIPYLDVGFVIELLFKLIKNYSDTLMCLVLVYW